MTPLAILTMGRMRAARALQYINAFSQQNTGTSVSLVIGVTGIEVNDLLIGVMGAESNVTWSGDTGWTEVFETGDDGAPRIAHLTSAASGSTSYTFTAGPSRVIGGTILQFRNAQIDVVGAGGEATSSTNPAIAPAITPTAGAKVYAYVVGSSASRTFTAPAGWTLVTSNSDSDAPSWAVFVRDAASDGSSTGTVSISSSSGTNKTAVLFSVKVN
jgi:hypothetical protein